MKQLALFSLYTLFAIGLCAQNYMDIAEIRYQSSPNNKSIDTSNEVDINQFYFDILLPIHKGKKNVWLSGATYENTVLQNHKLDNLDVNAHSVQAKLGLMKLWNKKNTTLFMVMPEVASDFKDLTSEDYKFSGIVLHTIKKGANSKLKFGAYYNAHYYGPFILPIFGGYWNLTEKLHLDLFLMRSGSIYYDWNKKLSTGIFYRGTINTYRLTENKNSSYYNLTNPGFFFSNNVFLSKNIYTQINVGHTLLRESFLYNKDEKVDLIVTSFKFGDNREHLNPELKNGMLLELKFAYRYFY